MSVEELIERAGFSDDDRDTGTSGLCGMFALALYRAVLDQNPTLVLVGAQRAGKPLRARDGGFYWRHAAVRINSQFYDIDGLQKLEWLYGNYVWGVPGDTEPTVLDLTPEEFLKEMWTTQSAWDKPFYERCAEKLKNSY